MSTATSTITNPAPPPDGLPVVPATAYLPTPGYALVTIIADHTGTCRRWHRHRSAGLDGDDLIRQPPCRSGRYRLAVTVATPAAVAAAEMAGAA